MHMEPDETPRQLGEDDELPDDLGSRIGDTLTFGGSGSYIRTISADEASRRLAPRKLTDLDASEIDKAIAFAKGYMTATGELGPEPGGVLDSRPRPRGLNRLIPTGRRRAARERAPAPALPPRPPVTVPPARLTIELVPKTSWYNNIRALVDELGWDRIRRRLTKYVTCIGYITKDKSSNPKIALALAKGVIVFAVRIRAIPGTKINKGETTNHINLSKPSISPS